MAERRKSSSGKMQRIDALDKPADQDRPPDPNASKREKKYVRWYSARSGRPRIKSLADLNQNDKEKP
ncbi:hypothetical protein JXM67_09800 [candidate division WOR-3 bacterium]|nr:hypothetical protein [candidate division WOR-3 bacterium]